MTDAEARAAIMDAIEHRYNECIDDGHPLATLIEAYGAWREAEGAVSGVGRAYQLGTYDAQVEAIDERHRRADALAQMIGG